MKVTYIGEELAVREAGLTFVRGESVDVPDDHPRAEKLRNNPTFTTEKAAGVEQPKRDELKAQLDDMGVAYPANAGEAKLEKLLADELARRADAQTGATVGTGG